MKILLVCGPYGSGTTAVAGLLVHLGAVGLGPFQQTNDPRTQNTYEFLAFREMVLQVVSEETMSFKTGTSVETALLHFKETLVNHAPQEDKRPIVLKHPASALIIPAICEVFDTRLIYLLRSMKDIEVTRQRRNWSRGNARDARTIYTHMFDHLVNGRSPTTMVRYKDLIEAPVQHAKKLAAFCGLECDEPALQQAASFIWPRRKEIVGDGP